MHINFILFILLQFESIVIMLNRSEAGIVNVYDYESLIPTDSVSGPFKQLSMLEPTKSFDQLTTPIDHLRFSHDGQMMVMASQRKKSALRLVSFH